MATEIIQERRCIEYDNYWLDFRWRERPGAGFTFECDEHGNVESMNEAAQDNYEFCLTHPDQVSGPQLVQDQGDYWEPAIIRCDCGAKVVLENLFTITCDNCDADYNSSGQRLAPRSQWGEETGESYSDIMRGGEEW